MKRKRKNKREKEFLIKNRTVNMTLVFSKRCQQSLKKRKIKVSISRKVRNRLWDLLKNYNKSWYESMENGFNYTTSLIKKLEENIKSEHGLEYLTAYSEKQKGKIDRTELEGFIKRGNNPSYLMDAIELFFRMLTQDEQIQFQSKFNQIMEESNLHWRMAEGKIFPVDSYYIEEEIHRKVYQLLEEVKFLGALQEFNKAREALVNGDYEGAIQSANLAVESTIKCILNIQNAKPGELYQKLIQSELIPKYYEGFLKSFEENILRAVTIIRNQEPGVGHGRGGKIDKVPQSLAELAVNLAGVLIKYLIKRYKEKQSSPIEKTKINEDEIPF